MYKRQEPLSKENPFKRLTLPMMTYPDCEACSCEDIDLPAAESETLNDAQSIITNNNESNLADVVSYAYDTIYCNGTNIQSECIQCYNGQTDGSSFAAAYNGVMFSGYDSEVPPETPYIVPPTTWYKSPYSLQVSGAHSHTVFNTSLPQSINLMNQRERYFNTLSDGSTNNMPNRMRVEVANNQFPGLLTLPSPNVVNSYEDQPLILIMDGNVEIDNGQLIAMVDSELILDPNLNNSGLTVNQFGTQSISGSMTFNSSVYVQAPCTYIKPNGSSQTVNLELHSPVEGQSYNFNSGLEYYQVIGGMTILEAQTFMSGTTPNYTSKSILWNYFIDKHTEYICETSGYGSVWGPRVFSRRAMGDFIDGRDVKIYFLSRGVDPYSPRQTLKYDLSLLFGETGYDNNPNYVFTGEYYPNIPIQPQPTNATDIYCPENHYETLNGFTSFADESANDNVSLFHGSYLFTPDSNQFTGFTTTGFAYYSSLGEIWGGHFSAGYGSPDGTTVDTLNNTSGVIGSSGNDIMSISTSTGTEGQGRIDGASYQWTDTYPDDNIQSNDKNYTVSPSYFLNNTVGFSAPTILMNDSDKLVFRSDRLPTSSDRDTGTLGGSIGRYQDFPLHLNESFSYFLVSDTCLLYTSPSPRD